MNSSSFHNYACLSTIYPSFLCLFFPSTLFVYKNLESRKTHPSLFLLLIPSSLHFLSFLLCTQKSTSQGRASGEGSLVATASPIPGDNAFFRELVYKKVQIRWKFKEEEETERPTREDETPCSLFLSTRSPLSQPFLATIHVTCPFASILGWYGDGSTSTREKGKTNARATSKNLLSWFTRFTLLIWFDLFTGLR